MSIRETRMLASTELRAIGGSGDADPLRIEGYASVFNRTAQLPGFRERMKSTAFDRAVREKQDVVCLFNHDSNIVLGRTTSGTLHLTKTDRGLHYSCELPNTQQARDIHTSIQRGDINGCSFAFTIPNEDAQEWSEERDDDGTHYVLREISDVNLHDVSPVTYPCYEGTNVVARAIEAPAELRASVEAKNKALGQVSVTPPAVEKRPYSSVDEVPDSVPAAHKKQWMEVWNSAYKKALGDGKSKDDAESSAFAQANGVIKKEKKSAMKMKEQREIVDAITNDIDSFEDAMSEVSCALSKAFPAPTDVVASYAPCYGGKYYVCETYEDFVIACECGTGEYYQIPYLHDESKPEGEEITFGTPSPVEKAWVPSDRAARELNEYRFAVRSHAFDPLSGSGDPEDAKEEVTGEEDEDKLKDGELPETTEGEAAEGSGEGRSEDDLDAELDDDFDLDLIGRAYDETAQHENHIDGGDCEEPNCVCQNRFCPMGGSARSKEFRGGMTRTKRVSGKNLTSKSFAYVGDPDKTETWKFPIHDASHVRNALARLGQAKGIPSDAMAGVKRKILAAAKKFGVDAASLKEENSTPIVPEVRKDANGWDEDFVRRARAALLS